MYMCMYKFVFINQLLWVKYKELLNTKLKPDLYKISKADTDIWWFKNLIVWYIGQFFFFISEKLNKSISLNFYVIYLLRSALGAPTGNAKLTLCQLVDKLCNVSNHNMVEGCFSHLLVTFLSFPVWTQTLTDWQLANAINSPINWALLLSVWNMFTLQCSSL